MSGIDDLDAARRDARAARERLQATGEAIQARLTPTNMLDEAMTTAREQSLRLTGQARRVVRRRPLTVAAIAAGIGLLIVRKPLFRLGRRLLRRGEETVRTDRQFNP